MSDINIEFKYDDGNTIMVIENNASSGVNAPIDFVFCSDISGSMGSMISSKDDSWSGTKLQLCKETQKYVVDKLGKNRIGLVVFDSTSKVILNIETVSDKEIVKDAINFIQPGLSTCMSSGIQDACRLFTKSNKTAVKYLLLFTDGLANCGIKQDADLLQFANECISTIQGGCKLVVLGYGSDCNHSLLQAMAEKVDGTYHFLDSAEKIPEAIGEEFGTALQTRQQNIQLTFDPAVMDIDGYQCDEGVVKLGDLLENESRKFIVNIFDNEQFKTMELEVNYIDCMKATTESIAITDKKLTNDPILVSDTLNIRDVTNTIRCAETAHNRLVLVEECIERINSGKAKDTATTKRLTKFLKMNLIDIDITKPELFRQFSNSSLRQRGGIYSDKTVANWSSSAVIEVTRSMTMNKKDATSKLSNVGMSFKPPVLTRSNSY